MKGPVHIFWFRRDLRIEDNRGLWEALRSGVPVLPIFIFDRNILDGLEADDPRLSFLHLQVKELQSRFREHGGDLIVRYDFPEKVFRDLFAKYRILAVTANRDYEPYALERDRKIKGWCAEHDIRWTDLKDHLIFDRDEVVKDNGEPYTVFTPYKRKWLQRMTESFESDDPNSGVFQYFPGEKEMKGLFQDQAYSDVPDLAEMGFSESDLTFPPRSVSAGLIRNYAGERDFPAREGTSRLGIHFRFGTISIREKARKALTLSETFLSELIWRDFYAMILYHFPRVVSQAFRSEYDRIRWLNDPEDFHRWCEGRTGYPLVDAGMRELNATGYMHNRVRMVTASFLTKHLLVDWRKGEAYFAGKLLDFDLASNNGGWQWAAGCGTDAAPYFRIFNPEAQQKKFDPKLEYIRKWVPEYGTSQYPEPIIDHKMARERCLATYREALSE